MTSDILKVKLVLLVSAEWGLSGLAGEGSAEAETVAFHNPLIRTSGTIKMSLWVATRWFSSP